MASVMNKASVFAPAIVRYGIALVFLTFGVWQWLAPQTWFGYLPQWLPSNVQPITAIHLNGTADFIFGLLLLIGLFTRLTALLATIHLASITLTLGWNDIAVRDFGLCIVLISIFLQGEDRFCVDTRLSSSKSSLVGKILYLFG